MNGEFAAYIGIDWADSRHAICLLTDDSLERNEVEQDAAALDVWVADLRARFPGRLIAVCLEASRGPLVYALLKYDFLTLFP